MGMYFIAFILGCCLGYLTFVLAERLLAEENGNCCRKYGVMPVSGIACILILHRFGLSLLSLQGILMWMVFLTASVTDINSWVIPDSLSIVGCLSFLGTSCFLPDSMHRIACGIFFGLMLSGGMLGAAVIFEYMTGKESLGGGDIKLLFAAGLYLKSLWEILFFVILSSFFGLLTAGIRRTVRLPFGPAIGAAALIMNLYGEVLTDWYRNLF